LHGETDDEEVRDTLWNDFPYCSGTALLLSPMDATFAEPAGFPEIPVKGMVTMVDFGAPFCAPLQGQWRLFWKS